MWVKNTRGIDAKKVDFGRRIVYTLGMGIVPIMEEQR